MQKADATVQTVFSDLCFLFRFARRTTPQVIRDTALTALAKAAVNAATLFAIPAVLYTVQTNAPLRTLFIMIALLSAALFGLYMLERLATESFERSRDAFRTRGCTALTRRAMTLSYPLATDAANVAALRSAAQAMGQHIHAPIPHLWHSFSSLLVHTMIAVVTAWLLAGENGWMTVVTVLTALVGAWLHRFVTVRGCRDAGAEAAADDQLAFLTQTAQDPAYLKDLRVFGFSAWIRDIHDRTLQAVRALADRRARIYAWYSVADAVLTVLRNGAAYAVLIGMAATDSLTAAQGVMMFLAIGSLAQSVGGWVADVMSLRAAWPSLSLYRRHVERADTFVTEGGAKPMDGTPHTMELRHVTFTYPNTSQPAVCDVSMTLREGERLAIVGEDGAGKTTLARLLCGLYDPDEGTVLLDGIDVKTLDRRAVYALFSTVFCDSSLPTLTIAQLMTPADEPCDEQHLWACLEQVGLTSTVRALPQGLHTLIGAAADGGVRLSGGQIGRLMLARAFHKSGDILLLDEPTAALDPLAEHMLYHQYDRLTAGKSAVILSNRALPHSMCDRILYIKHGRIAEEGTHDELMARGGDYAAMFDLQRRYYREGRDPRGDETK